MLYLQAFTSSHPVKNFLEFPLCFLVIEEILCNFVNVRNEGQVRVAIEASVVSKTINTAFVERHEGMDASHTTTAKIDGYREALLWSRN